MLVPEIRDATLLDLPRLLKLENENFKHPWNEDNLIYELHDNPVSKILVIEFNQELIGFLDYWHTFDSATIAQICVSKSFQNKGFGSLLIKEFFSDCVAKKVLAATLEVRKSNKPAISFYKKHGFNEIVVKPNYYTDGEDAIYMLRRFD